MVIKKNFDVIAIIPARAHHDKIDLLNMKEFGGKPLIYYTINLAIKSKLFDKVVVSTDSKIIQKISTKYGAECWFLRKKKLSSKFSPKKLTLIDLLERSEEKFKKKFEIIVDLDLSSPLRTKDD